MTDCGGVRPEGDTADTRGAEHVLSLSFVRVCIPGGENG